MSAQKNHGLLAAVAVALSVLALPAVARGDGDALDRRVDIALADAAAADTFKGFAKMVGMEADVDPGVVKPVTIKLANVRMRTVLDAVCESIGCRWDVSGSPAKLRVLPLQDGDARKVQVSGLDDAIDLRLTDANVVEVLKTFGQILSVETEIDPQIAGKVSFNLHAVSCRKALDAVCTIASCEWRLDTTGKGAVLRVTARK